jgi:hypothetical protein
MKIITPIDVEFKGTGRVDGTVEIWIQKDCGERFSVQIPNRAEILEQIQWISDNDQLKNLKNITPQLTTNEEEISLIKHRNALRKEMDFNQSSYKGIRHDPYYSVMPKYETIPDPKWSVVWSFWDKDAALMFKLAMGGSV